MQITSLINKIIGTVGLIISVILIINFSDLFLFLIDFSEKYLSRDNNIGPKIVFIIKICAVTGILLIVTLSTFHILNLTRIVQLKIVEFFQLSKNNICGKKHLDLFILIIAVLLGIYQI